MRCFVCRRPASKRTGLALDSLADYFGDRRARFPAEAGLCTSHARSAAGEMYIRVDAVRDRLKCLSLMDGHTILYVERSNRSLSGGYRSATKWRNRLLGPQARCLCGKPATELGHRIPLLCFRLAGLPARDSYFRGNLDPVCRQCNIEWMHFCYPHCRARDDLSKTNAQDLHLEIRRRIRLALRAASRRNLRVAVPTIAPRRGWPGNPVFDVRDGTPARGRATDCLRLRCWRAAFPRSRRDDASIEALLRRH